MISGCISTTSSSPASTSGRPSACWRNSCSARASWCSGSRARRRSAASSRSGFWFLSIGGGLMTLIYGFARRDIVIILGQAFSIFIYARNLMLIAKEAKARKKPGSDGRRLGGIDEPSRRALARVRRLSRRPPAGGRSPHPDRASGRRDPRGRYGSAGQGRRASTASPCGRSRNRRG